MTATSPSLTFGAHALLLLCALGLCACGKERSVETLDPQVHVLDFSGQRHTLYVALSPEVTGWVPSENTTDRRYDLFLRKESGYPFGVTGNGRRSVAFVGVGTRDDFEAFLSIDSWKKLESMKRKGDVYFSPTLRSEEVVEGCMFYAHVQRASEEREEPTGEGETHPDRMSWARVRIEKIEDTSVTLRVVLAPPLAP